MGSAKWTVNELTALARALCYGQICSHRKIRPCVIHLELAEELVERIKAEGWRLGR